MPNNVSIIIPTFNRTHTLKKVIDSYLIQKHIKEIIFVNDGSTDGTQEYLKELKTKNNKIKISTNKNNLGLPATRNIGIKLATGKYILMGEDDVILDKNYCDTLIKTMPNTNIAAGVIYYMNKNESPYQSKERCKNNKMNLLNLWFMSVLHSTPIANPREVPFCHAVCLGDTEYFKNTLFNASYTAREETDFYIRVRKNGARITLTPETNCFHLPQDQNPTGGGWSVGIFKYQLLAIKNNNMLIKSHYSFMKNWGMKGNKLTFNILHILNRLRILFKYYRHSKNNK